MPRGYRLFFAAVIGFIAIAIGFGLSLQPEEPHLAGEQGFQEQASNYRAGGADCEPSKIRTLPVDLRQGKADACAEAAEQHRQAANSIIEARRAADAADAQAISAYQQARIATWAGVVGTLTLIAAVAAAAFAERAAFHTKQSADSYRAREEATLLPQIVTTQYVIQGYAKNVGPTKAIIMIANSAIFPDPPPNPVPFIFPGHGRMSVGVEGEGQYDFGA